MRNLSVSITPLYTALALLSALFLWTGLSQSSTDYQLGVLGLMFVLVGAAVAWHQIAHTAAMRGKWRTIARSGLMLALLIPIFLVGGLQVRVTREAVLLPVLARLSPEKNVLRNWGITDASYRVYQALYREEAVVFTPRTDSAAAADNLARLGIQIAQETADKREFLQAWRAAKYPGYLRDAGVTHLLFDDVWLSFTSEQEYALLTNPDLYALELVFTDPEQRQTVYLYKVVGRAYAP